jgi:hypothetical protein
LPSSHFNHLFFQKLKFGKIKAHTRKERNVLLEKLTNEELKEIAVKIALIELETGKSKTVGKFFPKYQEILASLINNNLNKDN